MEHSLSAVYLQDVTFSYRQNTQLLQISALEIDEGERVFLYGPSGSGKSTLLGVIGGILRPDTGEVQVLGKDLRRISSAERGRHRGAEMGYIFRNFNLIPYLSVHENIALPCYVHAKRMKRIIASTLDGEVLRIAGRLDLGECLQKPAAKLRVDEKQRITLARAIIGAPGLVIADEPTSLLDRDQQEHFLRLLIEVCSEIRSTLIFASHDRLLMSEFERHISMREMNQAVLC